LAFRFVQHLAIFDFLGVSCSLEDRVIEFVDHLHEHFRHPVVIRRGHYLVPKDAGYSCEILAESLERFSYPAGEVWRGQTDEVGFVHA
jgi:L-fuconate dehydratase